MCPRTACPGAHHFFITFDTTHPDVAIADWLRARYPAEMTVVIQHWFENLTVTDEGFSITLNFGNQPEPMVIPFDAVRTFVDPSVEFGLRFETHADEEDEEEIEDDDETSADEPAARRRGCQPRQVPQVDYGDCSASVCDGMPIDFPARRAYDRPDRSVQEAAR